jgi:hypothetical protein
MTKEEAERIVANADPGITAASEVQVLDKEYSWDEALAFRLAYEVHRVIGNNINHYRKDTQLEILAAIRNAVKRNRTMQ